MKALALTLGALLLLLTSCTHKTLREPAQAASARVQCGTGSLGWMSSYSWCVSTPAGAPASGHVLYYLHGNGGNEKSWATAEHDQLASQWRKYANAPSAVVTVSFGSSWFLTQSAQENFVRKVMPEVEARLGFAVKKRSLLGESMGGFNASVLALAPQRPFERIAIVCPAVYNINPHASAREISQFVARQPAGTNTKFILKWFDKQRGFYRSAAEFEALNPVRMPERLTSSSTPLFLLGDEKDSLGVYEGALVMAKAAQKRGLNVQWLSIPNADHCQHTPASSEALAAFLAR